MPPQPLGWPVGVGGAEPGCGARGGCGHREGEAAPRCCWASLTSAAGRLALPCPQEERGAVGPGKGQSLGCGCFHLYWLLLFPPGGLHRVREALLSSRLKGAHGRPIPELPRSKTEVHWRAIQGSGSPVGPLPRPRPPLASPPGMKGREEGVPIYGLRVIGKVRITNSVVQPNLVPQAEGHGQTPTPTPCAGDKSGHASPAAGHMSRCSQD